MALHTGVAVSIQGPIGPPSVVPATAPPGPTFGVVGGYAIWNRPDGQVWLYGPKTSTGWPQGPADGAGHSEPVYTSLTGPQGPAGAAGTNGQDSTVPGPKGDTGSAGQGFLTTSGAPSDSVGVQGQYAIDSLQGFIYGPKGASSWPSTPPINMQGPAGPKGDTGAQGAKGDTGAASTVAGPKGDKGDKGDTGAQGTAGTNATLPQDFTPNSVAIAPVSGNANPSVLTQKDGSGNTLFSSDASGNASHAGTLAVGGASTLKSVTATTLQASGNTTVGGTLGVTGTSSLAAVTASTVAATGNTTVGGTLGVTGATTLASVTATSAAVTNTTSSKSLVLTSGGGGNITFADGTTQATAASGSGGTGGPAIIFMGGIYNTAISSNGLYGIYIFNPLATNTATNYVPYDYHFKFPRAGSIVGYSATACVANTVNNIYYYKNTGTSLGSIAMGTAAGASNSSPAYFAGTHTAGTYAFAAGDDIRVVVQVNGTSINTQVTLLVQFS